MLGTDVAEQNNLSRMGHKGLERLQQLERLNANPEWVNRDVYRLMYKEDLYIAAYERIKSNPGNMTPGVDGSTLDGFSIGTIRRTIDSMRNESYQFNPGRRLYIPKANGKKRPLTIAPPREKVVQEVIRMILNSIYDGKERPTFLNTSHGFRANRGTHTALQEISKWKNVVWFVEGDIKGCFDNINHARLIELISKRVDDSRFLDLLWKALRAGYMEFREPPVLTLVGTPQGSIVSPLLANIYLHELDVFVESLRQKYEKGEKRRLNPEYKRIAAKLLYARQNGNSERAAELEKLIHTIPTTDVNDPNYTRIHYVRYADDWIVGVTGPKDLAETIKNEVGNFLRDDLKLELSEEKTFIRHARTERAFFLGTYLQTQGKGEPKVSKVNRDGKTYRARVTGWNMHLSAPLERVVERLYQKGFCSKEGDPRHISAWIHLDEADILERYNAVLWGTLNYYAFTRNYNHLRGVQSILQLSAAKTLAAKHKVGSIRKLFRKHGASLRFKRSVGDTQQSVSLRLNANWKVRTNRFLVNLNPNGDLLAIYGKKTSRSRLGLSCAICGEEDGVEMHHLRHVRKSNEKLRGIDALMAKVNRKQIPVCITHHKAIHRGIYDGVGLSELTMASMDWV